MDLQDPLRQARNMRLRETYVPPRRKPVQESKGKKRFDTGPTLKPHPLLRMQSHFRKWLGVLAISFLTLLFLGCGWYFRLRYTERQINEELEKMRMEAAALEQGSWHNLSSANPQLLVTCCMVAFMLLFVLAHKALGIFELRENNKKAVDIIKTEAKEARKVEVAEKQRQTACQKELINGFENVFKHSITKLVEYLNPYGNITGAIAAIAGVGSRQDGNNNKIAAVEGRPN